MESSYSFSQSIASIEKTARGDLPLPDPPLFDAQAPDCRNVNGSLLNSVCGRCTIVGGDALLYYWPVDTASSSSNLTMGPKSSGLVTIVVEKNTFTSPTAYLSFYKPYAWDSCGIWHASKTSALVSMSSDAVTSFAGWIDIFGKILKPISSADLNISANVTSEILPCKGLPPEQMRICLQKHPRELPFFLVPDEIRHLDPSWNNCALLALVPPRLYPQILVHAQAVIASTTAAEIVRTSATATPAPSIGPQGAVASTTKFTAAPFSSTVSKPTNHGPSKNKEAIHSSPRSIATQDMAIEDPSALFPLAQDLPAKLPPSSKDSLPEDSAIKDPLAKEPTDHRYLAWLSVVPDSPAHGTNQQASTSLDEEALPKIVEAPARDYPIKYPLAKDPVAKNVPAKESSTKDLSTEDHPIQTFPASDGLAASNDPVSEKNQQASKSLPGSLLPKTIEPTAHESSAKDPSTKNPLAKGPMTKDPSVLAFFVSHDHPVSNSPADVTNQPGSKYPAGELLPTRTRTPVYDPPAYRQNEQVSEYLAGDFFFKGLAGNILSKGETTAMGSPVHDWLTKDSSELESSTRIAPLQYLSAANPLVPALLPTNSAAVDVSLKSTMETLDTTTLRYGLESRTSESQASYTEAVVFDGRATKMSDGISGGLFIGAIFFALALS